MTTSAAPPRTPAWQKILVFLGFWLALAVALMGAWVATSLTVYLDGPTWLAVLGALACFFVIPLIWELRADRDQVGGRFTDAVLRSGALSTVFLVLVVATHAETTFKALALRGDWFLSSPRTPDDPTRSALWAIADGYEWLYRAVRPEAFSLPAGDPNLLANTTSVIPPAPTPHELRERQVAYPIAGSSLTWPLPDTVHPAARDFPNTANTPELIGKYIAEVEPDLYQRARAVHDVVATRIAYSVGVLPGGPETRPSQEAAAVLQRGSAVCEGYAKLVVAIGRAAGLEVVYVDGFARSLDNAIALAQGKSIPYDGGHAWNAVRIDGQWHLMDATWDAGWVDETTFHPEFKATYFLIPPEVFIADHFPNESRFQLLPTPLSQAAWWRQPAVRPEAFQRGLSLPDGFPTLAEGAGPVELTVNNPLELPVRLAYTRAGSEQFEFCGEVSADAVTRLTCALPAPGTYLTYLTVADSPGGRFNAVARGMRIVPPR